MRIAITGGAGFVGSHVADVLMKDGHDIVLMDKYPTRWHPTVMYRPLDVTDRTDCLQAFAGVQVVFHLAAMSNTQQAVNDPWLCTQLNCLGTVNVLDGAKNAGVERVVIAGSTLISGLQAWGPEDEKNKLTDQVFEESPLYVLNSEHPYVTSKVFEEMIARDYTAQFGLPHTILRYGIQYGPRMTPGVVVHSFIERALRGEPLTIHGDGQQWRQYVHVHDVAAAHKAVIDNWNSSENATFNLVGQGKVTIQDIADAVVKAVPGTTIEYGEARKGDIEVKQVSSSHAEAGLGWKAKIGLEEGIAATVEWYRRNLSSGMRRKS